MDANLPVAQRAALALGTAEREKQLLELAQKHVDITAITNAAGYQQVHAARMALKTERVAIEKQGKAARQDATDFQKGVIAEEKRLICIIQPEEDRLQGLQDAWDAAEEEIRQVKIRAEQERAHKVNQRILGLEIVASSLTGQSAEGLKAALAKLTGSHQNGWTEEFRPTDDELQRLLAAYAKALADVQRMLAAAQAAEDEAKRLAADRVRLERERAEFEEQQEAARAKALAEEAIASQRRDDEERQARERQEHTQAAMSEVQGIQQQVIIAQVGRLGVRAGGTLECARDTLKETEEWPVTEANFGMFYAAAVKAKAEAVERIKGIIAAAERTQAEQAQLATQRREVEDAQRRQREADEARERAEREAKEAQEREARRMLEESEAAERRRVAEQLRAEAEKRAEAEAAEAARQREAARIAADHLDGRHMLEVFVEKYGHMKLFDGVARDIRKWLTANPEKKAA